MISESDFLSLVHKVSASTILIRVSDPEVREKRVPVGDRAAAKIVGEIIPLVERMALTEVASLKEEIKDALEFDDLETVQNHLRRLVKG